MVELAGKPVRLTEHTMDVLYRVGIALICAVAFVTMFSLGSGTSLWLDEMFEVEYCRTSTLAEIITTDPFTPPLFNILAWHWYQMVPYGEVWLRLPSIVFVTASIPFLAMTGRRLGGRRTGFIAAFLLLINAKVYTQCGLTFRTYALLLLLSSVCIYLYVRRMQTKNEDVSWALCIACGLCILALGYTHYFGILLAVAFFVVDLYLLARGRLKGIRAKVFASYGIAVLLYLPWAFVAFKTLFHVTGAPSQEWLGEREHWQSSTADTNIHGLLYWLCGECAETVGLFHVGAIVLVAVAAYQTYKGEFMWKAKLPLLSLFIAVVFVIGTIWFYSTYVNTKSMFWVQRYFIVLVPCITIIAAWSTAKIFSWIPTSDPVRFVAAFACVLLLVPTATGTINNDLAEGSSTRFYRNLTQYLEARPDIQNEKTLVLAIVNTTDRGRNIAAWKHYYFDRKDTRDLRVKILDGLDVSVQLNPYDLLQYDTVYVTRQHFDPDLPEGQAEVLKKYFKRHETNNPGGGTTEYYTKRR